MQTKIAMIFSKKGETMRDLFEKRPLKLPQKLLYIVFCGEMHI